MKTKGFYWHVHHDILLEWCYDYDERVWAIKCKPKREIKTRLKLFQPVRGELPKEVAKARRNRDDARKKCVDAGQKYDEAGQKWNNAGQKYDDARQNRWYKTQKYYETLAKHASFLEELHKKECGCNWSGKKIVFIPKGKNRE